MDCKHLGCRVDLTGSGYGPSVGSCPDFELKAFYFLSYRRENYVMHGSLTERRQYKSVRELNEKETNRIRRSFITKFCCSIATGNEQSWFRRLCVANKVGAGLSPIKEMNYEV
jgi:hypothetical protein